MSFRSSARYCNGVNSPVKPSTAFRRLSDRSSSVRFRRRRNESRRSKRILLERSTSAATSSETLRGTSTSRALLQSTVRRSVCDQELWRTPHVHACGQKAGHVELTTSGGRTTSSSRRSAKESMVRRPSLHFTARPVDGAGWDSAWPGSASTSSGWRHGRLVRDHLQQNASCEHG